MNAPALSPWSLPALRPRWPPRLPGLERGGLLAAAVAGVLLWRQFDLGALLTLEQLKTNVESLHLVKRRGAGRD